MSRALTKGVGTMVGRCRDMASDDGWLFKGFMVTAIEGDDTMGCNLLHFLAMALARERQLEQWYNEKERGFVTAILRGRGNTTAVEVVGSILATLLVSSDS
ncbi:MFS transporter, ACS family, glucarate transporter [Sesbania bispinosa]|nr:MFS transporter, ACS family, glucarate transporter [Sesbania bispinosa]